MAGVEAASMPVWCPLRPVPLLPLQPCARPPAHAGPPPLHGVSVTLQNAELWHKFHQAGTEMIITKLGRRMFPALRLRISGLEADARYFVVLELRLSSSSRFKFSGGRWVSAGLADTQSVTATRLYVHPDSPATGASWNSREVSFHRAKLTNHSLDRAGNLVLSSMHKYVPRIHVVRTSDVMALQCSPTATFSFPEAEFVAVTAYQNEAITKMKIDNNPFAKGFRETGMSRCKRKQLAQHSEEVRETRDSDLLPLRPHKRSCSDDRSESSHDDSGVSSLGSPSTSPALSPPPSSPTPPVISTVPKCSLSIERLLAKDDAPRPRRALPCCALPMAMPYPTMYLPGPVPDPLCLYTTYPYAYPHAYPQPSPFHPALCHTPLSMSMPTPFHVEFSPVDLSRDKPRDLSLKREAP